MYAADQAATTVACLVTQPEATVLEVQLHADHRKQNSAFGRRMTTNRGIRNINDRLQVYTANAKL